MATPIPPSLSQMLNPQAPAPRPAARPANSGAGFTSALSAQKAFFQQVTAPAAPAITPPTFRAADIARATSPAAPPSPAQNPADTALRRPGSYLNIVV
ncbi:hypothetical protein [Asticcacaulis sp. EMRT-3]|uniref:hypothetical protein n=1 Tax=Asticcacaulis sp. EMRT-3 TaxID=3040349 RepID=UPI0024AFDC75|nr:hypothetical protein [Asticcacaulis sp. EMRT-3]MDI7775997.1 hypothetical protein [Asticcacaulis sp. EMRT-3]